MSGSRRYVPAAIDCCRRQESGAIGAAPRIIIDTDRKVGLTRPTTAERAEALAGALAAAEWSAAVGDRHGKVMARWAIGLAHERRGDAPAALAAFVSVLEHLIAIRARLSSLQARALSSGAFKSLVPRLAALAIQQGHAEAAFTALEFRRGLAIAALPLTDRPGCVELVPDDDGAAHYFAVSVFQDHGVFAVLRTAGGLLHASRIRSAAGASEPARHAA